MAKFYPYKHIEPEVITVGSLLKRQDEKVIVDTSVTGHNWTAKAFLDVAYPPLDLYNEGNEGYTWFVPKTNWDRLKTMYGDIRGNLWQSNVELYNNGQYDLIELIVGTQFWIPSENIRRETLFKTDDNVIEQETFKAFMSQEQRDLFDDPDYLQIEDLGNLGTLNVTNRGVTCYMWLRAAGSEISEGAWVNVSAFINNQKTYVGDNGGNFTLDLAPIVAKFAGGVWGLDSDSIKGMSTAEYNDSYYAVSYINKVQEKLLRRQQYFFHTAIQANDLVYIKFEDLKKDIKRKSPVSDFLVSGEEVAAHDWDMIGLIDAAPQVVSSEDNNILIRVQGRDLIKAWIDDETIIFPEPYGAPAFANADVSPDDSKLLKRLNGGYLGFNTHVKTSIQYNLQFIVNQLSNTGYVSNNAFSGYNNSDLSKINRRLFSDLLSKYITIPTSFSLTGNTFKAIKETISEATGLVDAEGVWNITKLIVDDSVRDRRVVDNSMFTGQGSMLNFVRKVCQEPLVEFFTDTYGKNFYLIARKPPFDKEGYTSLVYDISVTTEETTVPGNITSGESKRLSDIIGDDGKILTTTQLENVEVIGLTNVSTDDIISPLTLAINEGDVLNEQLAYHTEVYSWYSLNAKGLINGENDNSSWLYLKAVKFEEYVEVWGNKPYQFTSNYSRFTPIIDSTVKPRENQFQKQALHDLKYMVESMAYLPFTRKGTITIHGDRRFKKGMFLHYTPTNEIFYIDGVANNRSVNMNSIDRTTTLTVSRGMVEPYIRGIDIGVGEGTNISYFNIIDTEVTNDIPYGEANAVISKWKVNKEVFNFFLNRRQWIVNTSGLANALSQLSNGIRF